MINPVSAKQFFDDFSFDLETFSVKRNGSVVGTFEGLFNEDEFGEHIAFFADADIVPGDVIDSSDFSYVINEVLFDEYEENPGIPDLLKAYF